MEYSYIEKLKKLYESNVSKPGLLRVQELLKRLGNPQNELKFIHIAGTNGKGSTCAYIDSVMRTAGYKTALFTSPHIYDMREYIRINNELISHKDFDEYIGKSFDLCDDMIKSGIGHPTFFELITASAINYFADMQADIAIIEAGLGGRNDATNIIFPIVSVITRIGLDHEAYLGKSIQKIAKQKAGIIKINIPVILAPRQKTTVKNIIRSKCRKSNSTYINTGKYKTNIYESTLNYQSFTAQAGDDFYRININNAGRYQVDNALSALCVVEKLKKLDYDIKYSDIKNGFNAVKLENRLDYDSDKNIIIDGSHNPQSVKELRLFVKKHIKDKKIVLICSILKTKDAYTMVKEYKKFVDYAFIIQSSNMLSMNRNALAGIFKKHKIKHQMCENIKTAVEKAKLKCYADDAIMIVSGSLYMIADVKYNITLAYRGC